jgi:hypothetical protein
MGGACSTKGEKRNAYRLLVGKPEGKRPLGRPRRRWVDGLEELVGVGGELLSIRYCTFGFHNMLGNYQVAT